MAEELKRKVPSLSPFHSDGLHTSPAISVASSYGDKISTKESVRTPNADELDVPPKRLRIRDSLEDVKVEREMEYDGLEVEKEIGDYRRCCSTGNPRSKEGNTSGCFCGSCKYDYPPWKALPDWLGPSANLTDSPPPQKRHRLRSVIRNIYFT